MNNVYLDRLEEQVTKSKGFYQGEIELLKVYALASIAKDLNRVAELMEKRKDADK